MEVEAAPQFSFSWECALTFDPELRGILSARFGITDLLIEDTMPIGEYRQLTDRVRPYEIESVGMDNLDHVTLCTLFVDNVLSRSEPQPPLQGAD